MATSTNIDQLARKFKPTGLRVGPSIQELESLTVAVLARGERIRELEEAIFVHTASCLDQESAEELRRVLAGKDET